MSKINGNQINNTVSSYTNTGSAGGTVFYANDGGLKRVWGNTSAKTLSPNAFITYTIDLPTSFFTTVQAVLVCIGGGGAFYTWAKVDANAITTSTLTISLSNLNQGQSAVSVTTNFEVIGV